MNVRLELTPLFETMRVRGGQIPFLSRHVARLTGACRRADLLTPPIDIAERAASHAMRAPADRVIRVEWNGAALRWDDRDRPAPRPMRVATVEIAHPGYPIKSVERVAFDIAAEQAARAGADEPLLLTADGYVTETARFAIAWIDGTTLRVPELDLNILPSIGRERLLELAPGFGLTPAPGRYRLDALAARSILLVNAVRGVAAVEMLDGVAIPPDRPVVALAEAFWPSA